jgi:dolichol kinase
MHRWDLPIVQNSKINSLLRGVSKKEKTPSRLLRKLWHLAGGSFFPVLALFVSREALLITVGVITGIFLLWEVVRFVFPDVNQWMTSHLGMVLKKEEQFQPTGTTHPACSLSACILLCEKYIAITSLLFLAIGDPVASLVGEKYGKHAVFNKSLEGSLACLISCLAVGMLMTRSSLLCLSQ